MRLPEGYEVSPEAHSCMNDRAELRSWMTYRGLGKSGYIDDHMCEPKTELLLRKGISSCGIIPKIILEAQSKSKGPVLTVFIEEWGFHRGNAQVRLYVR